MISNIKRRLYLTAARWFWLLARRSLRRWQPRVIIITGSVGKTTMLNLLAAQHLPAHFSHNANSAYGVAFDILGLDGVRGSRLRWLYLIFATFIRSFTYTRRDKFYIVEVDAERPREASLIARNLQPEVVITTPIGLSHASFFDHLVEQGKYPTAEAAILDEFVNVSCFATKLALFSEPVQELTPRVKSLKTGVEFVKNTEIKKYRVEYNSATFTTQNGEFKFNEPMPEAVGLQLLLCERLMQHLKLPIIYDLKDFVLPPGRNNYFVGQNGSKLIDSSYNAHLISMQSVLDMVRQIRWNRKWLVISDMIQQGKAEQSEHESLAAAILAVKPENVILIGHRVANYTAPLLKKAGQNLQVFADPKAALPYLQKNLTSDLLVVFKGSQYLEWLVEKLLKNPADAKLLARREPAAIARRKKRGLL
ncbi:MAG: hypothetical protein LBM12_01530 [Candidatus Nomurabacteria bacterium]|jgi:UDP-N-acetylmuramyl pentapeptide synthase|nr:hypothetical protein [Candidatus Nomurabacteria bacterium]